MDNRYLSTTTLCTSNIQTVTPLTQYHPAISVLVTIFLSLLTIICVIGNTLVVATVILVDRMQDKIGNCLIVSLAVSDWLVGVGVMPLAIVYQVTGKWTLSHGACTAWVTLDVMLCTASILNLTTIAIDKYLCITQPLRYNTWSRSTQISMYCASVWILSIFISITPVMMQWNPVHENGECIINQHLAYQLYATIGAFYIPLFVMIVLYVRIHQISCAIVRADRRNHPNIPKEDIDIIETDTSEVNTPLDKALTLRCDLEASNHANSNAISPPRTHPSRPSTKSVRTLGIIMGLFTACWLPFFICALVKAGCKERCYIPQSVSDLLTWLGYINSCINPLIYARFHRDFGTPMKEMMFCRWRNIRESVRRQFYEDQYGD